MLLYIARHAWAGHYGDPGWPDDSLRELTPEGIERYRLVVDRLAERGVAPRRIATSPYTRCRQTAELLANGVESSPPIDELEALEPGSDLKALLEWTNHHAPADVAWVGHNPDVERLAEVLIRDRSGYLRFAKGSMTAIRFDESLMDRLVRRGGGALEWRVTAKKLGV